MILAHWLKSLVRRNLTARQLAATSGRTSVKMAPVARRRRRQLPTFAASAEVLEERVLLAATGPDLIEVFANNDASLGPGNRIDLRTNANPNFNQAPREITLRFSEGQAIDPATLATGIAVIGSGHDGDFTNGNEVSIVSPTRPAGFIGIGNRPNEVVIRFADTLTDDTYRIIVQGSGPGALTNTDGQRFLNGFNRTVEFKLDLAPQVEAVVPQPIIRAKVVVLSNAAQVNDGDQVRIGYGNQVKVFEFDTNNQVTNGTIRVALPPNADGATITQRLRNKINEQSGFLTPGTADDDGKFAILATYQQMNGVDRVLLEGTAFTPNVTLIRPSATNGNVTWGRAVEGGLRQRLDTVVVHFTPTDKFTQAVAENVRFYRLVNTTTGQAFSPRSATFLPASNAVVLTFFNNLPFATWDLRVGDNNTPSNTRATATQLGSIFTTNAFTSREFLGAETGINEVDLYQFDVTPQSANGTGTITATVNAEAPAFPINLRLFNSNGGEIAAFSPRSGNGSVTLTATLAAGTYYLGVSGGGNVNYNATTGAGAAGGAGTSRYTINVASNVESNPANFNRDDAQFTGSHNLGSLGAAGQTVLDGILPDPQTIPQPLEPGGNDEPGHRHIPVAGENHISINQVGSQSVPPGTIRLQSYNFQSRIGTDPQGNPIFNQITETQKQRVREIYEIIGRYAGIRFVETAGAGTTIALGDLRAADPTVASGPGGVGGLGGPGLVVVDAQENFGNSPFGGQFFQIAFHEIGHSLGLQHAYDLPSIMGAGVENPTGGTGTAGSANLPEAVFPSNHDITHLRRQFPRNSTDIDLYRFTVDQAGKFTAQTFAERGLSATNPQDTGLDTVLTLYKGVMVDGVEQFTVVARNDNFFGADSGLEVDLETGTYFLGVSSVGNENYNPTVSQSGAFGRRTGNYRLQMNIRPDADDVMIDADGRNALDGDLDGRPGGDFHFNFQTGNTVYVDRASPGTGPGDGSLGNPFRRISPAISQATAGQIIHIVGNGGVDGRVQTVNDNFAYQIGIDENFNTLADGATFQVPKNVTVMIDADAVLKLRQQIIDVGTSTVTVDRSGGALQVLGTPGHDVQFTSYRNDAIGGDSDGVSTGAARGDWGGLVFRADSDAQTADISGRGIFLNTVNHATIGFGGGQVFVNSQSDQFAPVHLVDSRPTVTFNTFVQSAGAAISGNPNSFRDDDGRLGPLIRGNHLFNNSLNGLFVRSSVAAGLPLERLTVAARFTATDIVHIISDNLLIAGGAGGDLQIGTVNRARAAGRLLVNPGIIVKLLGSRIESEIGRSQLIAEGTDADQIIFTSQLDDRFGAGGSFDTTNDGGNSTANPGDWGGLRFNANSSGSLDKSIIAYAGGTTPIEGDFASFNPVEIVQADVRIANSTFVQNAAGVSTPGNNSANGFTARNGRGNNFAATIFVRGAQPTIISNVFANNGGAVISVDANSLEEVTNPDAGRVTGRLDLLPGGIYSQFDANYGPLVRLNRMAGNGINGMEVRGNLLTTASVWDDTDIVHVLRGEIVIPNFHTFGGLRLQSSVDQSLVVKLANPQNGAVAGFTASGQAAPIDDRIGGSLQVIGTPGHNVILTSLYDNSIGAGTDPNGVPLTTTFGGTQTAAAGDWRGLLFDRDSNDRNVAEIVENEASSGATDSNPNLPTPQFLGDLAKDLKSGDENSRLGFNVNGVIDRNRTTDTDVYSFTGQAGTEVWLDLDHTDGGLHSVLELVNGVGTVLAQAYYNPNTGGLIQLGGTTYNNVFQSAVGLQKDPTLGGDYFTTNPYDAGMRVLLPGQGTERNTYFVRVRSLPNDDNGNTNPISPTGARTGTGASGGRYELQIRLKQRDEVAGSTVRYADIRFASTAIEVDGLPRNSPLVGEVGENGDAPGNGNGQNIGNLLQTNRAALSIAGTINAADDVDFYQFDVTFPNTQRIPGVNAGPQFVPVTFDLDYADGLSRANTRLAIFDSTGRLVLTSRDSNIADDRPAANTSAVNQGNDLDDLSRGSVGTADPFIGPVMLPEGTYRLAVFSNNVIPTVLNQTLQSNAAASLLRLEPVDSVRRIVDDRVNDTGATTAAPPVAPNVLTNSNNVPYFLSDVSLFLSSGGNNNFSGNGNVEGGDGYTVRMFNPFTGQIQTVLGGAGRSIRDIAMRPDGELYAYSAGPNGGNVGDTNDGNTGNYLQIDTGTAEATQVGDDGIITFGQNTATPRAPVVENSGLVYEALTFTGTGDNAGFAVANRDRNINGVGDDDNDDTDNNNILYQFNIRTGAGVQNGGNRRGAGPPDSRLNGAGTDLIERGIIGRFGIAGNANFNVGRITGIASKDGTTFFAVDDQGNLYRFTTGSIETPTRLGVIGGIAVQNEQQTIQYGTPAPTSGTFQLTFQGQTTGPIAYDATAAQISQALQLLNNIGVDEQQSVTLNNFGGGTFTLSFGGQTTGPIDPFAGPAAVETALEALAGIDDVQVAGGVPTGGTNEQQIVDTGAATSGTFTLMFGGQTTGPINFNATPGQVQTALEALPNINPGDVAVVLDNVNPSSGRYRITFQGALAGRDVAQVTIDPSNLAGGTTASESTAVQGLAGSVQYDITFAGTQSGTDVQQLVVNTGGLTPAGATGNVVTTQQGQNEVTVAGSLATGVVLDFGGRFAGTNVPQIGLTNNTNGAINVTTTQQNVSGGVSLQGLSFAPQAVEGGRFSNVLIAVSSTGTLYAVNSVDASAAGIFVGGRSQISTGAGNVTGLAFGTLQRNLWHVTPSSNRGTDPGHGVTVPVTQSRTGVIGGQSFYFGNEQGGADAGNKNGLNNGIQRTINFPGGAGGSLVTQEFSLEGVDPADLPVLYFNYFLETEGTDFRFGNPANADMRDAFRVFIAGDDGNWSLLATNDSARDPRIGQGIANGDDEFDYAPNGSFNTQFPQGQPEPDVQEAFDNTGGWRQLRASLANFVGLPHLRLRFDFSTAASMGLGINPNTNQTRYSGGHEAELRAVRGYQLRDGQTITITDPNGGTPQTFEFDLGPTFNVPSGAGIAASSGSTFTVNVNGDSQTFTFVQNGPTSGTTVGYTLGSTATEVATNIRSALNQRFGFALRVSQAGDVLPDGVTQSLSERVNIQPTNPNGTVTATSTVANTGSGRAFIEGTYGTATGNQRVIVNQNMTRDQVAAALRQAMADAFVGGDISLIKAANDLIYLYGQTATQPGVQPSGGTNLGYDTELPGDVFGAFNTGFVQGGDTASLRGVANNVEGVYVDDLIIGFAERGELVTAATADTSFTSNLEVNRDGLRADRPNQDILVGPYQVELRRTNEYGVRNPNANGPTFAGPLLVLQNAYDTNFRDAPTTLLRVADGKDIVSGTSFTVSDGLKTVTLTFIDRAVRPVNSNAGPQSAEISYAASESSLTIARRILNIVNNIDDPQVSNASSVQDNLRGVSAEIAGQLSSVLSTAPAATGTAIDDYSILFNGVTRIVQTAGNAGALGILINGRDKPTGDNELDYYRNNPFGDVLYYGDRNQEREQGQLIIEQNRILFTQQFGIRTTADRSINGQLNTDALPSNGAPINFSQLNTESLAPGIVIQNNVIGYFGIDGIELNGFGNQGDNPVKPFTRIVNNTIYGDQTNRPSFGIHVLTNSAATILNNIITNVDTGIGIDGSSAPLAVVGSNLFQNNNNNGTTGTNGTTLAPTEPLFVDPANANFYLAAGSQAIDSSINSLGDRPSLVDVKNPLGIPPSNIIAPFTDRFGQARVDDPNVASPPGLGSNVFRDRGAIERADFSGPTASLLNPTDLTGSAATGPDINPAANAVRLDRQAPSRLVVQLSDLGIGIDDTTVTSNRFVLTFRSGDPSVPSTLGPVRTLVNGVDYLFSYDTNTKQVVLLTTGARFDFGAYQLTVNNSPATGVKDLAGNRLQANQAGGVTAFSFEFVPPPLVSVDTGAQVVEGDSGTVNLVYTVRLSKALRNGETFSFDVNTADGTATATPAANSTADYVPLTRRLTFTAGGPLTQTVTVLVNGDIEPEQNETVLLSLSNGRGLAGGVGDSRVAEIGSPFGIGTIINDDFPFISTSNPQVVEGDNGTTQLVFTVTLGKPVSRQVRVDYTTADGTATAGQDYVATSGTLIFTVGQTSQTVSVTVNGDISRETNETVLLLLSNPFNGTVGTGSNGTGTILNDDTPGVIIEAAPAVSEGSPAQFIVRLTKAIDNADTTVVVSTVDRQAIGGQDYTPIVNRTLTFTPGQTSKVVSVNTLFDNLIEPTERFVLFVNSTNANIARRSNLGVILDNTPSLSIDNVTVAEGGLATFTVTLSQASAAPVTVEYATGDANFGNPATADVDYNRAAATLTFAPGTTTQTISVQTLTDNVLEGVETYLVNLRNSTNAAIAQPRGVGRITDDTPTLSVDDVSVDEGVAATFTISLSRPSTVPVTVTYTTTSNTATGGADYQTTTGTVTFNPGQTTQSVTVPTTFDNLAEPNETFFLDLTASTNAAVNDGRGVGTINDVTPLVTVNDISIPEGTPGTFTITLSRATNTQVTVNYQTTAGTATANTDYQSTAGQVIFAAGQTTATVTVNTASDTVIDRDETFFLDLTSSTNGFISDNRGVATIIDATPLLSISDATVLEGSGFAQFIITLSQPSNSNVTVFYSTSSGTATSGSDFQGTFGQINFAPGQVQSQPILVQIFDDNIPEPAERFFVSLSGATNADIDKGVGVGTILDRQNTIGLVTGPGAGFEPFVRVYDPQASQPRLSFFAYDPNYRGGVRVATGDVNGDGVLDVITAPGSPGTTGLVRIFDGASGALLREFTPFGQYLGGIDLDVGDTNADGFADILVAPLSGSPTVRLYDGNTGNLLRQFPAYPTSMQGGISVALGDVTGDGRADILVVPQSNSPATVKVFDGRTFVLERQFTALGTSTSGADIASADVDGDGRAEIIVAPLAGTGARVQVYDGRTNGLREFFPVDPAFTGGLHLGTGDPNFDGRADIIVAPASGARGIVRIIDGTTGNQVVPPVQPYPDDFTGGVFVAGLKIAPVAQPLVASGSLVTRTDRPNITNAQAQAAADAAIRRFAAAGASAAVLNRLRSVKISVDNLDGAYLGLSTPGSITLDANGAGRGWFVDETPDDDSEFVTDRNGILRAIAPQARFRTDLLSVVTHELAHQLGFDDVDAAIQPNSLMTATVNRSVRRASQQQLDDLFANANLADDLALV